MTLFLMLLPPPLLSPTCLLLSSVLTYITTLSASSFSSFPDSQITQDLPNHYGRCCHVAFLQLASFCPVFNLTWTCWKWNRAPIYKLQFEYVFSTKFIYLFIFLQMKHLILHYKANMFDLLLIFCICPQSGNDDACKVRHEADHIPP